jgi:glucose/arabinose dehydrogenase
MRRLAVLAVSAVASTVACAQAPFPQGPAKGSPTPASEAGVVRADTVARDLENPWAVDFLPGGRFLVTERPGRLRIIGADGRIGEPVANLPRVHAVGQGGLLDVTVAPDFATSNRIYFTFSEPGEGGTAGTAVARARLVGNALEEVQVIWRQAPKMRGGGHYGSRLVIGRDGNLFVSLGDRMLWRDSAQSLTTTLGKVVRITPEGGIPADNPFRGRAGVPPEIWSYGHRNQQGAALDPATGQLWTVEHGPRGGDELNRPQAGKNYGWPVICYCIDYNGSPIAQSATKDGMEQPVYYWNPVIAASGLTFYTGTRYPGWAGNVFVGAMNPGGLVRLVMANGQVTAEHRYLGELRTRVRDVQQGPDGYLYLVTDHDNGSLLRVVPAGR